MYSKERGILLHSQRSSVFPHPQPLCCRRRLCNDDGTCQRLCSNVFPHSDHRLSIQSPHSCSSVSHTRWLSTIENDTRSHLSFSLSHGISREPPWPGHEGRVEGQKVAQGGGELHVEHHHTEGKTFIHSRHTLATAVLLQHVTLRRGQGLGQFFPWTVAVVEILPS